MSTQLAELDKLKAEFVSVASHELKTPINVILGYLQLMQDGIYGPLSSKQVEILVTIEAQGRTLARLAAQLLDVTRFEAGGGRIEPRTLPSRHPARRARARLPRAGRAARRRVPHHDAVTGFPKKCIGTSTASTR